MKKISIMILVLVAALASCKKTPEVNLKYVDVERDLVTVGTTTANIQCDYEYIATLKKAYFCYGEGETNMNSAEMRVVQNTLYVELVGLRENTTYSYYYEFHNGFNSMRTVLKTFKTEAGNGGGNEPPTPEITLPTVITASVTEITTNSAKCGGEVTNDGGGEVTERGVCWSTNANPSLNDSHVAVGTGIGAFNATVSGLNENTTYHVRAYATNEAGTAYGLDREFVTLSNGGGGGSGNAPTGAINGLFTINENGDQVYFSQGNLQYQASTNTWRFAEYQWDYVGGVTNSYPNYGEELGTVYENGVKCNNNEISSSYPGWIDLFGWGTSGWDCGNTYYRPWDYDNSDGTLYGPPSSNSLAGSYVNSDWGYYNPISNGGNQSHKWRTLTRQEWHYILFTRNTPSNIHFAKAVVNEVNGVILLPDCWSTSFFVLNDPDVRNVSFSCNVISSNQWYTMENYGAVFLPAAGSRMASSLSNILLGGDYSSASFSNSDSGSAFGLGFSGLNIDTGNCKRYYGISVRLVQDVNPQNKAK